MNHYVKALGVGLLAVSILLAANYFVFKRELKKDFKNTVVKNLENRLDNYCDWAIRENGGNHQTSALKARALVEETKDKLRTVVLAATDIDAALGTSKKRD